MFLFGDHCGGETPPFVQEDYGGSKDAWAGPAEEKAVWDAAHDLYRAYGHEERMGYHCHVGPHKLRPDDWERFMDFADRHL